MMVKKTAQMDAASLRKFLLHACDYLEQHKEEINALNVFPVPDGDTGINMYLTVSYAAAKLPAAEAVGDIGTMADVFAKGTLMGARGNSGVILSQIFRGLATSLAGKERANAAEMAAAMQKGVDLSYRSVMKPVEGTILTVYREFAAAAEEYAAKHDDIIAMLRQALQAGFEALARTPELLPVLKEAGVVDAGGQGLLRFMEGGLNGLLNGKAAPAVPVIAPEPVKEPEPAPAPVAAVEQDIEFAYCTQLLIQGQDMPIDEIRTRLSQDPPGDSLLVVGDGQLIKIHFHNNHPGQVLEYCAGFGTLHDIIIDNMRDQHHQTIIDAAEAAGEPVFIPQVSQDLCGVIAVCAGAGMSELFQAMGAQVISGGQTMNPSAEDILRAVEQCPAQQVVILPNNSNIILTAGQVKDLTKKPVAVCPSKYVTQGLTAMLSFNPEQDAEANLAVMEEGCRAVINGELTYAVRATKFNGFKIAANDILGLNQGVIAACGKEIWPVLSDLIAKMMAGADEPELLSLYFGHEITRDQADDYAARLAEQYPQLDIEAHEGGQPLYYFLISIE